MIIHVRFPYFDLNLILESSVEISTQAYSISFNGNCIISSMKL